MTEKNGVRQKLNTFETFLFDFCLILNQIS
jgi:hypothetical protein